jgi:hypothetical protein
MACQTRKTNATRVAWTARRTIRAVRDGGSVSGGQPSNVLKPRLFAMRKAGKK